MSVCRRIKSRHPDVLKAMMVQPSIETLGAMCQRRDGSTYFTPLEMGSEEEVQPLAEVFRRRGRSPSLCPRGEKYHALVHSHPAWKSTEGMTPWRPDVPTPDDLFLAAAGGAENLCVVSSSNRRLSCFGVQGLKAGKSRTSLRRAFSSDIRWGGTRYVRELDSLPKCRVGVAR